MDGAAFGCCRPPVTHAILQGLAEAVGSNPARGIKHFLFLFLPASFVLLALGDGPVTSASSGHVLRSSANSGVGLGQR